MASRRSYFAQISSANRQKWLKENLQCFFSVAWEEICRQAVPYLFQKEAFHFGKASRYWQHVQASEWDVIAKSMEGDVLLIGECKWTSKIQLEPWIHKTLDELKAKGLPPINHDASTVLHYVLFVPEKPSKMILPPRISVIDAEEVIRAFI